MGNIINPGGREPMVRPRPSAPEAVPEVPAPPVPTPTTPAYKRINKKSLASLVWSVGLVFCGLAYLILGNVPAASAFFAGAFGTAGLPAIWGKGLTISIDGPGETPEAVEFQFPKSGGP